MRFRALAVSAVIALYASSAPGGMTTVSFSSDYSQHHLAQFDGTALYDSDTGKLTIAIQNTTSASKGGFLTGLALAAAGPAAEFSPDSSRFADSRNQKGIVYAGPFGKYHAGAATGREWSSGKHAVDGIAAGGSHIFVFDVTAANASSLTVASFLTPGKTGQEIVANFKKLDHHGSDRAGAVQSGAVSDVSASPFDQVSEVGLLPIDDVIPLDAAPAGGPAVVQSVPLPPMAGMATFTLAMAWIFRRKLRFVRP